MKSQAREEKARKQVGEREITREEGRERDGAVGFNQAKKGMGREEGKQGGKGKEGDEGGLEDKERRRRKGGRRSGRQEEKE